MLFGNHKFFLEATSSLKALTKLFPDLKAFSVSV